MTLPPPSGCIWTGAHMTGTYCGLAAPGKMACCGSMAAGKPIPGMTGITGKNWTGLACPSPLPPPPSTSPCGQAG
eukprot:CAMPEP_0115720130 /NCGR_PEP_ID=MMETSP0272-20121206/78367_1 /TAXON_ID=71861 /ORGANISM="Scrippsiella trochoidea, Strain CCMP3099" /LENGTH=74 /DNA_ID=CAMNT_0003162839 /DNA_START=10 /DNA_END=230 /DNA_ORIENTATION=-